MYYVFCFVLLFSQLEKKMPTSLVVSVVDKLLPSISLILNSSLSLGYFAEEWKAALVDPRLKKSGQADEVKTS